MGYAKVVLTTLTTFNYCMRSIKISDELFILLNQLKRKNARATGRFKSYEQIMLEELPSPDEYEPEIYDEDDYE